MKDRSRGKFARWLESLSSDDGSNETLSRVGRRIRHLITEGSMPEELRLPVYR